MIRHLAKKAVLYTFGTVAAVSFVTGAALGIAVASEADRDEWTQIHVVEAPERAVE